MARTLLLIMLVLALGLELVLTLGGFFAPAVTFAQFGVTYGPDTAFLGYIVAWALLFVSLVDALALWQVWRRQAHYPTLCYLLGLWWIGIGVGIYAAFGKPDNLLLDSLKGLLIIVFTWRSQVANRLAT